MQHNMQHTDKMQTFHINAGLQKNQLSRSMQYTICQSLTNDEGSQKVKDKIISSLS